jgi:hypothetical protein
VARAPSRAVISPGRVEKNKRLMSVFIHNTEGSIIKMVRMHKELSTEKKSRDREDIGLLAACMG